MVRQHRCLEIIVLFRNVKKADDSSAVRRVRWRLRRTAESQQRRPEATPKCLIDAATSAAGIRRRTWRRRSPKDRQRRRLNDVCASRHMCQWRSATGVFTAPTPACPPSADLLDDSCFHTPRAFLIRPGTAPDADTR